jgi:DNA polymerase IV
MQRFILHIDMDSFFATVEQQANPQLRGKPIVVSGKEGTRSVIVASSKEAKFFGVKTAMMHHEARKFCPNLIFVQGDGLKYSCLHKQFIKIFKKFTDRVEIFSIDEAFLDLTGYVKTFAAAEQLAEELKAILQQELGEWVTSSIGIAKNKLLAKLASDMDKPNGLVVINEKNLYKKIDNVKLTDFCGIGRQIEKHLTNMGIDSLPKLRDYPKAQLLKEFGPSCGNFLYDLARGENYDEVCADFEEDDAKSVSRTYTLPHDSWDKEELLGVLLHLTEKVGRELRKNKQAGKTIVIFFRYADFTHQGFRQTLPGYVDDGMRIFMLGKERLKVFRLRKGVRLVGAYITNLVKNYKQLPLWEVDRKIIKLLPHLDKINSTYGELTIKPAFLLKSGRLRRKVGGFRPDS